MPSTIKTWFRVPAGAPIRPGRIEVRKIGIRIVFTPVTTPKRIREHIWLEIDKPVAPIRAAIIVNASVTRKVSLHP